MKKTLLTLCAAAAALCASAEGYQVNNMSARQTGMGHVGTAMQLGSESIFFNPAATAYQDSRFDFSLGMTGIWSNCHFRTLPTVENGYTPGAVEKSNNFATPIHAYFNWKPTDRLAVGVGFYTPDGSSISWGESWSGAHLVQDISLMAFAVQPTVSYKISEHLSIGAGLSITWGNFDLSRSMLSPNAITGIVAGKINPAIDQLNAAIAAGLPGAEQMQATLQELQAAKTYLEANRSQSLVSARLKGSSDVGFGVNAGALWNINEQWSLGMTWRSRVNLKVGSGTAALKIDPTTAALIQKLGELDPGTQLLPPLDQGTFRAELPLPTTVTWGVSFRPTPKWELGIDLQWVGWSAYKALNVEFNEPELGIQPIYSVKNYSNTLAFRFGGEYRACKFLTARMGMYVDESPVSSHYLNPETPSMTKVSYTAGLTLRPAKWMSIDLAYCYVSSADPERTGTYPVYNYADGSLDEVFGGNYKLHANVISIGLGFRF